MSATRPAACLCVFAGKRRCRAPSITDFATGTLREAHAQWERSYLVATLETHAWNIGAAAKDLGISMATLYRYLKAHGLRENE